MNFYEAIEIYETELNSMKRFRPASGGHILVVKLAEEKIEAFETILANVKKNLMATPVKEPSIVVTGPHLYCNCSSGMGEPHSYICPLYVKRRKHKK